MTSFIASSTNFFLFFERADSNRYRTDSTMYNIELDLLIKDFRT
jgi:hypothetical protein